MVALLSAGLMSIDNSGTVCVLKTDVRTSVETGDRISVREPPQQDSTGGWLREPCYVV